MKLSFASVCALLLLAACGSETRAPGQWPLSTSELEKTSQPSLPGEATYRRYCVACHGADGRGNGGVTGRDFVGDQSALAAISDSALALSVREGKRGERAVMPAHKAVLSDTQIREAVAYVRQRFLQNPVPSP